MKLQKKGWRKQGMKPKLMDLFAGVGGLSLDLKKWALILYLQMNLMKG